MPTTQSFIGIDISKAQLDIAVHETHEHWQCAYDETAVTTLVAHVTELAPRRIVVEATGGLETVLVSALAAAALPVVVVNPRQVRAFAKALGLLAKTDRLDAHVLAHVAAAVQPPLRAQPDAATQTLQAVVTRRRQLVEMLVAERIRRKQLPAALRPQVQRHITWLEQEVVDTETALTRLIQQSPHWRAQDDLLRSVPGVGPTFSRTLLANGMELGRLNRKQMAALIGVAPFTRESGQWRGKRTTWGGRARVRAGLYMSTLVATRCNPVIHAFYQRLLAAGKAKKVALTACMRKLLTMLNAMVKHQTKWQEVRSITS